MKYNIITANINILPLLVLVLHFQKDWDIMCVCACVHVCVSVCTSLAYINYQINKFTIS